MVLTFRCTAGASATLAVLLTMWGARADAQQKPVLTAADYGKFETIGAALLSPNGKWLAHTLLRVDETRELHLRGLDRDTLRAFQWGGAPVFSADSRWLAWTITLSPADQRRMEREKKPVHNAAGLLDLTTGAERRFEQVAALAFDASGRFLALHGYAPEEPKGKGGDVRLLDLPNGSEVTLASVGEFVWSDIAGMVAFTVASGRAAGNGVQVMDGRTGALRSLDASGATYRQLAWRKTGSDLAVLRSVADAGSKGTRQVLLAWRGVERANPTRLQLFPDSTGVPDTLEVVEHFRPRWSDDGRRLAVGLRPVSADSAPGDSLRRTPADSARAATDDELPTLQLWHTSDVVIYPGQKVRAVANARRTLLAVWEPEAKRLVQVGSDVRENTTILEGWRTAIERRAAPHPWGAMFGRPYHDVWSTDLTSGATRLVAEKVRTSWESGDGRYLLWFDGKDYWTHNIASGARVNITTGLPTVFADTAYDTPTDQLPPLGVGGWFAGDRGVLLYDRYDIWQVSPDGSGGKRLTTGTADAVVHRVVRLELERPSIDATAPIYFSLYGEWGARRGWGRLLPGKAPERLLFLDKNTWGLSRADSADVITYTAEARDDPPDHFVTRGDFAAPRQVTRTSPFAGQYAWGRTELFDFRNETGRRLQGVLLYPANFDSTMTYPMIVNAYEKLSGTAHQYEVPSERDYYSHVTWTQRGYFVLLPDIHFRARDPGVSLLETLRPAVAAVVARGVVDPKRVGFVGHSWGGYHATYVATHSTLFAAAIAGAPLTDFVSFMGQIHWTPGIAELEHWETGQARMEVPYWEDPEAHHRNSPIHKVHEMETPLLMVFGDQDGTVDWDQGTEFYNFARRAGKEMVLLVYEGELHGYAKKPNQIDYHRRILEWFGHYLMGEQAPEWIGKGIPLGRQEAEKRRVAGQR